MPRHAAHSDCRERGLKEEEMEEEKKKGLIRVDTTPSCFLSPLNSVGLVHRISKIEGVLSCKEGAKVEIHLGGCFSCFSRWGPIHIF